MKYGEGSLFKKPRSPFWYMSYWLRGQQRHESTKETDYKKARRRLRQRIREVGADLIGAKKFLGSKSEKLTVNEILDSLKKDLEARKKLSPQVTSKMKPLIEALGYMPAISVTDDLIREYMILRLKGPGKKSNNPMARALRRIGRTRPVANATLNRELQFLRQAYNLKAKEFIVSPSIPKLDENVREGFFERADFEAIVEHLPADLKDFARWGYFTGWRKGEISSLGWSELNMENRQLRLRGEFSKNNEARTVPLMGELWEIIKRRWKARRYKGENGETIISPFVFFRKKGRGIPTPGVQVTEFRKTWRAARDLAGKPDALFHDFRRTAVRNMVRAGVSRKVAMLISGHKTESVFERYNITDDQDLEDAVRKTQSYVEQLPKKREEVVRIGSRKKTAKGSK
jgi:integrase